MGFTDDWPTITQGLSSSQSPLQLVVSVFSVVLLLLAALALPLLPLDAEDDEEEAASATASSCSQSSSVRPWSHFIRPDLLSVGRML